MRNVELKKKGMRKREGGGEEGRKGASLPSRHVTPDSYPQQTKCFQCKSGFIRRTLNIQACGVEFTPRRGREKKGVKEELQRSVLTAC